MIFQSKAPSPRPPVVTTTSTRKSRSLLGSRTISWFASFSLGLRVGVVGCCVNPGRVARASNYPRRWKRYSSENTDRDCVPNKDLTVPQSLSVGTTVGVPALV